MTATTILFIAIAAVLAFSIVVFMYGYKSKYQGPLRWVFGALRFITLFSLFLLIINPKFSSETFSLEKPLLSVLVDNSASIAALERDALVNILVEELRADQSLLEKFNVQWFQFSDQVAALDSLDFSEKRTNISQAIKQVSEIGNNERSPVILLSDGNQTYGADYQFLPNQIKNSVYPLVVGDTSSYSDLKIALLNTNRYSFLNNEFPIEAIVVYQGKEVISSNFTIRQGDQILFRKTLNFNAQENSQAITLNLPSTAVGLQRYRASIEPFSEEKNPSNNSKNFAVEVIDEATNVLIVSDIIHPDMGALKKSIESNEQRKVQFLSPSQAAAALNDYQLVILFQPDRSFSVIYSEIEKLNKNTLTISGLQTDWNFLNSIQNNFSKEALSQTEDVSAILNLNYGAYAMKDIDFESFVPLRTEFGDLLIKASHDVILEQSIDGFRSGTALLATMENDGRRDAIWDGEGIWKWRAQSFRMTESFIEFDEFVGGLIQYLASNKRRSRLEVDAQTFYYNNDPIIIAAQYFDQNYKFDQRAQLNIKLRNKETGLNYDYPMLLKSNYYQVDLAAVPSGDYDYTISVTGEAVARSGSFTIVEFNVEQQFLNADVTKLQKLATDSQGKLYFEDQSKALIQDLLQDENYAPIQKSTQKVVPLIDWKYLLILIALSLAAEWFIRKYNGLI